MAAGAGLLVGTLVVMRPADALALSVAAGLGGLGLAIARLAGDGEYQWVRIFVLAFVLRVVTAYLVYHVVYLHDPGLLAPDEVGHDRDGWLAAAYWHGAGGARPAFGYDAYVGVLYYVAPAFQMLPRLVNAFGGALTALFVGLAARNMFDRESGRVAGFLTAVWPSAVLWSSLNLKDGWSALGMALIAYQVSRLRRERLAALAPGILVGIGILAVARSWMLFVIAAGLACGLVATIPRGRVRAVGALIALAGGTFVLVSLGVGANYIGRAARVDIAEIRASTTHGESAFQGGINVQSPAAAIRTAPRAVATVVLAPYPWNVAGIRQALAVPESLVWYVMLVFVWQGVRRGLRDVPEATWPLLGAVGGLIVAIATLEGNLGLIYRHRLTAFVVLFAFAGAGWARARRPLARAA